MNPQLLFVPSLRVDRGMGHLRRCLAAAAGAGPEAAVYYTDRPEFWGGRPVFERALIEKLASEAGVRLWGPWPDEAPVPTVVADLQAASPAAFRFLRRRSLRLVGWDEGGPCRRRFPFLVDSLPHDTRPEPNLRLPGLLGLAVGPRPPRYDRPLRRLLVAFGGADPAGLTGRFLEFVRRLEDQGRWSWEITVVRGPLSRFLVPPGLRVLEAPTNLPSLLGDYDLTVTSWGLTALESLAAGTPVLLLNPSGYHERLTRAAGLPSFGVRIPRTDAFFSGLEDAPAAARRAFGDLLQPPVASGAWFAAYQGDAGACPVCATTGHPVFARTPHKSYHRCRDCGLEYLSTHNLPPKQYTETYFFEEYQRQYGKTYLQDFAAIEGLGRARCQVLASLVAPAGKTLLDVGCAYGPFLSAAASAGFSPRGLDISEAAVAHVRSVLGFPAQTASFVDAPEAELLAQGRVDAVTLWYVIEHFPDLDRVLRRVSSLLEPGGLFAFSTPNGRGLSRTFRPAEFWAQSPDDHFSIWNPQVTRRLLARYGFEVLKIRMTGLHPERHPWVRRPDDPLVPAVRFLGEALAWGDTFEVYARKTKEIS